MRAAGADMTQPDALLREMTARQVVSAAFAIYRDHLANLVMIALIPHLGLLAVDLAVSSAGLEPGAAIALLLLVTAVLNALVLAAMTYAIGQAVLGDMPGPLAAYQGGFARNVVAIIAAYLVIWWFVTLGLLLFVLPGLVVGGLLLPTVPAIVLERRLPMAALARAYRMMRPDWLKATAVFSFVVLISGVLPLLFHLIVGQGPFSPLLGAIVGAITLPLAYSANVVLYLSVRSREGYTREILAKELAS
jgi:hypothetical protein